MLSLGIVALVLVTLMLSTAPASAAAPWEGPRMIELLNAERAAAGVSPLVYEPRLEAIAEDYAHEMADNNFAAHISAVTGSTTRIRAAEHGYTDWEWLGEALAEGFTSPEAAIEGLRASGPHWVALMSEHLCEIGVGHAYVAGTRYGHYWALEMGCGWR